MIFIIDYLFGKTKRIKTPLFEVEKDISNDNTKKKNRKNKKRKYKKKKH